MSDDAKRLFHRDVELADLLIRGAYVLDPRASWGSSPKL